MQSALAGAVGGDRGAADLLYSLLYDDLKGLARARRAALGRNESLRTTELVHESWLRLSAGALQGFESRRHFFGAAANAMRNVLIDRARRRAAQKRESARKAELDDDLPELTLEEPALDVLALHMALEELERGHARAAQVVTLRFFGGLALPEVAEVLGFSLSSVERDWRFGRAWLQRALEGEAR